MVKLDNKGFGNVTLYLIGIILILLIGCATLFYRGQVFVAKLKTAELAIKQKDATIVEANKRIIIIQNANKDTIKKYQVMLDECVANIKPCQTVVINGCPKVKIIKGKGVDKLLDDLRGGK
jgi:hypothetical protein